MFLKSLSLKGFKSFADPAVLEFEPGITVVVGPNGSGKSNVVDAVAWVLGAQGPRTVRSAKMEDVIFMGTASRPALGRAEVALTIDNSAGKLATDLAEITITRTLFRSGDSEYAINGAPCRLLDIQELLSDTGVGRQQHVIISQGHLDAILEARPEDRRAVIEEAAGVLKYRRRRERSERRLASTEENLERLFDLVREVKRQIRPLERQAAAARSHAGLADELRAVRLYLAGSELTALDARQAEGTRVQVEQRANEERLRQSLGQLDADTERTADEMSAQRESDLASALARAEGMVERARGLTGVLRERQRSLAQALDAAADADVVSTLEAEGARLGEELGAAEAEAAALAPENEAVVAAEAEVIAQLEAHLEAWGDGTALRLADEAVTVARGQLSSLEHALERDRRSLDQLTVRLTSTERRALVVEGEDHELAERLAETEQARHSLQTAVADTEAAHGAAIRRLESAEEALRQRGAGAPPLGGAGRRPGTGARRGPGAAGAELLPASTAWSAPCSTWSRWMQGGSRRSRRPPGPRWPPLSCRAASRPKRRCPAAPGGCHRSGARPHRLSGGERAAPTAMASRRGSRRNRDHSSTCPAPFGRPRLLRPGGTPRHTAGRDGVRAGGVVGRHRSGPGPSRHGGRHPRRRPLLVHRMAGAGRRRGGHRRRGRGGPLPGGDGRNRGRPDGRRAGCRPRHGGGHPGSGIGGGPVRRSQRGGPPDRACRPAASG